MLHVATFGGGVQDAQRTALFVPFTAQDNVRLQVSDWNGNLTTLQRRAATGSNDWDLVLMEAAPLQLACLQGLLLPQPLTQAADVPSTDRVGHACGIAAWRMDLVLAWDKGRIEMIPSWGDFWNVAQHPGKRGLRRDPRGTLEIALMADGVQPADIYRTLSTQEGVDRAFRKLDQLKPYIVWWSTPAEAVQIIESGAVLMTSAPDGEVATADRADHHSFGAQWAQSLGIAVEWAIPSRIAPEHRALARNLLAFVSDPARRAGFASAYPGTPTSSDDDRRQPTLITDDGFWLDHLVPLTQRFDRWADAR